jgi:hypothetical protein
MTRRPQANGVSRRAMAKPRKRLPPVTIEPTDQFDARGMRRVFGCSIVATKPRKRWHASVFARRRDGKLFVRFWSPSPHVEARSFQIQGMQLAIGTISIIDFMATHWAWKVVMLRPGICADELEKLGSADEALTEPLFEEWLPGCVGEAFWKWHVANF